MDNELLEMILAELRDLRSSVDASRLETERRVSVLETNVRPLIDNGQPGKFTKLENRMTSLEHWHIRITSYASAVSGVVSAGMHFLWK
jgi:hypothetical protein